MLTTIATFLIKRGIPLKFARPLIYIAFAVLLISALGIGKCAYDRSIIDEHDTKQALKQSEADRKADQAVAVQRRQDDIRINQEASELERIAENETTDDMARRLTRHRCIRMQQSARRDGREPPAC